MRRREKEPRGLVPPTPQRHRARPHPQGPRAREASALISDSRTRSVVGRVPSPRGLDNAATIFTCDDSHAIRLPQRVWRRAATVLPARALRDRGVKVGVVFQSSRASAWAASISPRRAPRSPASAPRHRSGDCPGYRLRGEATSRCGRVQSRHRKSPSREGARGRRLASRRTQGTPSGLLAATDAAAQLVELRETEAVGVLHDHDGRVGDVHAHLDDCGGDQNLRLVIMEALHDLLFLGGWQATVQKLDLPIEKNVLPWSISASRVAAATSSCSKSASSSMATIGW